MKVPLDPSGKIFPPSSPTEARLRISQLRYELGKIDRQINDPNRKLRFTHDGVYNEFEHERWRTGVRKARAHLADGLAQNEAWLRANPDTDYLLEVRTELLQEALAILKALRDDVNDDGETILEPAEVTFIDKVNEHFASAATPAATKKENARGTNR